VSDTHVIGVESVTPDIAREETSLFGFVNILLKYRFMVGLFVVAFGAVGFVEFLQSQRTYTSRMWINITPSRDSLSQLALLNRAGNAAQDVAFTTELLRSAPLLRRAAEAQYTVNTPRGKITAPLSQLYGFEGPPERHADEMVKVLTHNVRMSPSPQTGNLWIFIDAPYPDLPPQIGNKFVELLDEYGRMRRRTRAAGEREFIEQRVAEARANLTMAENRIVEFRLANRRISSPSLEMEYDRLDRDVSMRQQHYTALLQAYDRARIAEARNVPAITVLEAPVTPLKAERSSSGSLPLLRAITGLLIAIMIAFIRERLSETSESPTPAFETYRNLKREAARDLLHPLRSFSRLLRPRANGP